VALLTAVVVSWVVLTTGCGKGKPRKQCPNKTGTSIG
jgi:hypothetical protein